MNSLIDVNLLREIAFEAHETFLDLSSNANSIEASQSYLTSSIAALELHQRLAQSSAKTMEFSDYSELPERVEMERLRVARTDTLLIEQWVDENLQADIEKRLSCILLKPWDIAEVKALLVERKCPFLSQSLEGVVNQLERYRKEHISKTLPY